LDEEFTLRIEESNDGGPDVYLAFLKPIDHAKSDIAIEKYSRHDKPVFSFVPPSAGMFIWVSHSIGLLQNMYFMIFWGIDKIRMHFEDCPVGSPEKESLEIQLWTRLAEAGLLIAPGYIFDPVQAANNRQGHYRFSFSEADVSHFSPPKHCAVRLTR
jgi:aromatic amino acid aminotransferase I